MKILCKYLDELKFYKDFYEKAKQKKSKKKAG